MAKGHIKLAAFVSLLFLIVGFVAKLKADETAVEVKRAALETAAKDAYEATDAAAVHTSRMCDLRDYMVDLKEKNPQRSLEHIYLHEVLRR